MKKIIAAFDGLRFSESTLEYAIWLSKQYDAHITGVFLHESTKLGYAVYESMVSQSLAGRNIIKEIDRSDAAILHEAIERFESHCRESGVPYTVHRDRKNAVRELLHESVFADLLVVDAWETFSYIGTSLPGWFIKNILHDTQCPVMVVPKQFHPFTRTALLYDGSPSSMHAIKMLSYVLPETRQLETHLLCAKQVDASSHLPDNKLLKEWMKRHYAGTVYEVLAGDARQLVTRIAGEGPGVLVAAGAYHRSDVSMWFRQSMANLLMQTITAPIFIAHT